MCVLYMERSDVENVDTFREFVEKKDSFNNKIFFIIWVLNISIMCVSIKYFINYSSEIYLIMGLFGTLLVGGSISASSKSIVDFSLTRVDFNFDKAESLLNSKLMTGVGTIFLFISILLGYTMNCINY